MLQTTVERGPLPHEAFAVQAGPRKKNNFKDFPKSAWKPERIQNIMKKLPPFINDNIPEDHITTF